MWLAYVDESYNSTYHWVTALLVKDERVNTAQEALRDVVDDAVDAFGIPSDSELHGFDVFHGERHFAGLKGMPRARIAIYSAVLDELVNADPWIIRRGVQVPKLYARYNDPDTPQRVAMTHLIERIDGFCSGSRGDDDLALI